MRSRHAGTLITILPAGTTAPNTSPLASNSTVTTEEDTDYTFSAGDFNGIVKLIECRLFSAFIHEAKLLNLRGGDIDNVPRFRSESG